MTPRGWVRAVADARRRPAPPPVRAGPVRPSAARRSRSCRATPPSRPPLRAATALLAAACISWTPGGLDAQLPTPSGDLLPPAARARGTAGLTVNPATLALSGGLSAPSSDRPDGASGLAFGASARSGLDPVTLDDLGAWSGRTVPRAVRERWLVRVEAAGGQRGRADATLEWLSLRRGAWGVRLTTRGGVDAALSPGAAELLLFGNAGRTGEPRPLRAAGSALDGWALTRAAVAAASARPLTLGGLPGRLAVGGALTLTVGHGLLLVRDAGSGTTGVDPGLRVALPRLETAGALDPAGWGLGLDVGTAWEGGAWRLGATLEEAVSTFRWSRESLRHRRTSALLGPDVEDPDGDVGTGPPPRVLLEALDDRGPAPVLTLEAARDLGERAEVGLGARRRLGPGLATGPERALSLAVAWRLTSQWTTRLAGGRADGRGVWSAGVEGGAGAVRLSVALAGAARGVEGVAAGVRLR